MKGRGTGDGRETHVDPDDSVDHLPNPALPDADDVPEPPLTRHLLRSAQAELRTQPVDLSPRRVGTHPLMLVQLAKAVDERADGRLRPDGCDSVSIKELGLVPPRERARGRQDEAGAVPEAHADRVVPCRRAVAAAAVAGAERDERQVEVRDGAHEIAAARGARAGWRVSPGEKDGVREEEGRT